MLKVQKFSNERSKLRKAEFFLVSIKEINYLILQYFYFISVD